MNISDTISEIATFTAIDYTVFSIILSFSVAIGIYFAFFSDNMKTNEDYLAGGHNMKALPIGISLVARYQWNSDLNQLHSLRVIELST